MIFLTKALKAICAQWVLLNIPHKALNHGNGSMPDAVVT